MTIAEFCRWAGIGRTMAYKQMADGHLKSVKVEHRRGDLRCRGRRAGPQSGRAIP